MRTDFILWGPNHWYHANWFYNETDLSFGYLLDDADDKIAFGFQADRTATISGVGMYIIDIIGSPPTDYQLGLTTLSGATGTPFALPTDTLYSNATWQDFNPLALGSGWSWVDLATPVNVTKGDFFVVQVKPGATTPDGSNYIEINDESTLWSQAPGIYEYTTIWNRYNWLAPAGIIYTDGTVIGWPIITPVWEEYASPAEWGVEFQLPVQATCIGLSYQLYQSDNDAPFKFILADSSDVELASITTDTDYIRESDTGSYFCLSWDTPENDPILSPDTTYRLYLKPTSASTVHKHGFIFVDDAHRAASMPYGANWKMIERPAPASGWSYTTGGYPWISLLLTDFQGGNGGDGNGGDGGAFGFIG
jgi:hypothetical protein